MTPLEEALAFSERTGRRVFFIAAGRKVPLAGTHGHLDATSDADAIHALYPRGRRCRWAWVPDDDEVVVDTDPRNGYSAGSVALPATEAYDTPGGGQHLVYRRNGFDPASGPTAFAGVDIKTSRGFLVGYSVDGNRRPRADAPAWVGDASPRPQSTAAEDEDAIWPQGERNDRLFRYLSRLRNAGMDRDGLLAEGRRKNNEACDPPLPAEDVRRIAGQAAGYEVGDAPALTIRTVASPKAATAARGAELILTPAADIELRAVRWLWDQRVPDNELTLLAGREGAGKSTFDAWLTARVSTGTLPGEYEGTPRDVIVVATEDDWSTTLKPRLMAAGADLERVFRAEVRKAGTERAGQLHLPADLDAFEAVLRERRPALVVVSPLMSRLAGQLDSHKDQEVRQALEPLVELAHRYRVALLGLIHLNKSNGTDPMRSIMASVAFGAVSRAVLMVHTDPDDRGTRLLGQPKNSLGQTDDELGLEAFRIEGVVVGKDAEDGRDVVAARIAWTGRRDGTSRELMADATASPEVRTRTTEAMDWLRAYLTAAGGRALRKDIERDDRAGDEYGRNVLDRARKRIGATAERTSTMPSESVWVLSAAIPMPAITKRKKGSSNG